MQSWFQLDVTGLPSWSFLLDPYSIGLTLQVLPRDPGQLLDPYSVGLARQVFPGDPGQLLDHFLVLQIMDFFQL